MKRVLTFLALMLLPLSVMAMTPVSDSTLSDVTGQAGVNINANLTMDINIGTLAWGDADGVNWATTRTHGADSLHLTNGGFVGVTGLNISNLVITARTGSTAVDNYGSYDAYNSDPLVPRLKPITIDVAQDAGLYDNKVFVRIGLGSLKITMDDLLLNVSLGAWTDSGAVELTESMGQVLINGLGLYISPRSYVDIFSHDDCGVTMNLNVIIDHVDLEAVAWGDTDGLGNVTHISDSHYWNENSGRGFVGLTNFDLNGITITGRVAIDVAATSGVLDDSIYLEHYRELVALSLCNVNPLLSWAAYGTGTANDPYTTAAALVPSLTVVRITFGGGTDNLATEINEANFNIGLSSYFRATVSLFTADEGTSMLPNLGYGAANYKGTALGDIYLSNFNVSIHNNSWVDIWAH